MLGLIFKKFVTKLQTNLDILRNNIVLPTLHFRFSTYDAWIYLKQRILSF